MNKFIKQQQELARNMSAYFDPSGYAGLSGKELDTITTQIITNTGAEIMRRVESDKHAKYLGWIKKDDLKQHIKGVIE
jgi:hypothetical protein